MSILLGAVFFLLIQTGVHHHYKKAFIIAAGVICVDIIFVILALNFTVFIKEFLLHYERYVALIGALVMFLMGVYYIRKRRHEEIPNERKLNHVRDFFLKPFAINILNPANAAWWLGLYSLPPAVNYVLDQKVIFAIGAIATVFFTEVGVAAAAQKLKPYTKPQYLARIDLVAGIFFFGIGIKLLLQAI